jgi:16S rRNA (guanine(966)-N(2))-methyltransferase RsmD
MKIGSGRFRGRNIDTPCGKKTRPTSGRLKKALFDIIAPDLDGARVLDLYAGAGALGLEAISRGASHATFVERGRSVVNVIAGNLDKLGISEQAEILQCEIRAALHQLAQRGEKFDFVMLDPPYRSNLHAIVLWQIDASSVLASDGLIIIEHHHKLELGDAVGSLRKVRRVRAGESCLTFYKPHINANERK